MVPPEAYREIWKETGALRAPGDNLMLDTRQGTIECWEDATPPPHASLGGDVK
jgi:hypothetical protein